MDPRLIDDLDTVSFPLALRGYDRDAVEAFLHEVAERIRRGAESESDSMAPTVRRQLDRVGEQAEGILVAADGVAEELRSRAEEDADGARVAADEEARRIVLEAGAKAEEILVAADGRAERIIAEGSRRRHRIEAEITELALRRDQIATELRRLSQELRLNVVENTRIEPVEPSADAEELDPAEEEIDVRVEGSELEPEPQDEQQLEEPAPKAFGGRFRPRDAADPAEL